jgi:adenylosuccinate synthase
MNKKVDVLLGLQWGDEGKGKIVDLLAPHYDVVARFQGGPNAGHTLEFEGKKFVLHTIPSGVFQEKSINYIGNGVVLDPVVFKKEIETLAPLAPWIYSNLYISEQAHLILPTHRLLDAAFEQSKGKGKIGSTLKGIGPTYTDKISRQGIRVGDLNLPSFKEKYDCLVKSHRQLLEMLHFEYQLEELEKDWFASIHELLKFKQCDGISFIQQQIETGKKILAEGAQGSMLDIDFGSYPFVTSSNTISAGACTGLGIAPSQTGDVIGISKAYCTRVGSGPFPTELNDAIGEELRKQGHEYGSTTGRPRRCGWLDLVALKFAVTISGVNRLMLTKADVMSSLDEINVAVAYKTQDGEITHVPYSLDSVISPVYKSFNGWKKDISQIRHKNELPLELIQYIKFIEEYTGVRVELVSVGPDRNANVEIK